MERSARQLERKGSGAARFRPPRPLSPLPTHNYPLQAPLQRGTGLERGPQGARPGSSTERSLQPGWLGVNKIEQTA